MSLEGELNVRITWDGERVRGVAIASTRPRLATQAIAGRTPRSAADLLSRLYSVCGAAQGVAAASALDVAAARLVPPTLARARSLAIRLEAIGEHAFRLGIDWARAMGQEPLTREVRAIRTALAPILASCLDHALERVEEMPGEEAIARAVDGIAEYGAVFLGMSPAAWLAGRAEDLERWKSEGTVAPARWYERLQREHRSLGTSAVALMPPASAASLERAVVGAWQNDQRFAQRPSWDGMPVETGPLPHLRTHPMVAAALAADGNSVATRLIARLTALAMQLEPETMPTLACPPLDAFTIYGTGYAMAHTARGLLLHRAALERGTVAAYDLVAPTDWNFRGHGPFEQALAAVTADTRDEVQREAMLVARAIDPCVACAIEVRHA